MPRRKQKRDEAMGAWAFAFIAMLLALGAVVVAGQAFVRSNDAKDAVAAASGTAVSLSEYTIDPSIIAVEEGGSLTVTNDGTAAHNLEIKGTSVKTPDIAPGSSERLHPPDDLVTGHRSWPVRGKVPFREMQVGSTHTTRRHPNPDFSRAGIGVWQFYGREWPHCQWAGCVHHPRFHCGRPRQGRAAPRDLVDSTGLNVPPAGCIRVARRGVVSTMISG